MTPPEPPPGPVPARTRSRSLVPLLGLLVLPLLATAYTVAATAWDMPVNARLLRVHDVVWYLLLAAWVVADSAERRGVYRPYEFGFLVFLFAIVYVPWYLVSTRRWRGALMVLGLAGLYMLPVMASRALSVMGLA